MLWFTIWFMVILKIPVLYLAYVIWWAVKDPPDTALGPTAGDEGEEGPRRPTRDRWHGRPRRRGPHGSPDRKRLGTRVAGTRARAQA